MNVRSRFVVDPIEASLNSQTGQHSVLRFVPIVCGYIHGTALVVERVWRVHVILVPALDYSQFNIWPLIHHTDC